MATTHLGDHRDRCDGGAQRRRARHNGTQGPSPCSFTGYDLRTSTSKTLPTLWTGILLYGLVALLIISLGAHLDSLCADTDTGSPPMWSEGNYWATALIHLDPVYLVLIGGPFAAAVLAKATVTNQVRRGEIQKVTAEATDPLDLVRSDDGGTDLVDLQYVLFNFLAMGYALALFIPHPAHGLPAIPPQLAGLTGISAAAYVTNKASANTRATLTAVSPTHAHVKDLAASGGCGRGDRGRAGNSGPGDGPPPGRRASGPGRGHGPRLDPSVPRAVRGGSLVLHRRPGRARRRPGDARSVRHRVRRGDRSVSGPFEATRGNEL
ncbi:hypothetical protein ACQ86D_00505 [Streptomyces galilaeus]